MGFRKRKQQPQDFREESARQRAAKDAEKAKEKKTGTEVPAK